MWSQKPKTSDHPWGILHRVLNRFQGQLVALFCLVRRRERRVVDIPVKWREWFLLTSDTQLQIHVQQLMGENDSSVLKVTLLGVIQGFAGGHVSLPFPSPTPTPTPINTAG